MADHQPSFIGDAGKELIQLGNISVSRFCTTASGGPLRLQWRVCRPKLLRAKRPVPARERPFQRNQRAGAVGQKRSDSDQTQS